MPFSRYGVYFTPPPGPFADAGSNWLGWDLAQGQACGAAGGDLTHRPRKYGFHATLKAPFYLVEGASADALMAATADLAHTLSPVVLEGLDIRRLGTFLAITPTGNVTALRTLAARVVVELDRFRAPLTDAERARKTRPNMHAVLRENLERYGYPHVMDRFNFHMTLTGPLSKVEMSDALAKAEAHFQGALPISLAVDALTLVGEDANGYFHQITRFPIGPNTA